MADIQQEQYLRDVVQQDLKAKQNGARVSISKLPASDESGTGSQETVYQAVNRMLRNWILPPPSDEVGDSKRPKHVGQPWQAPDVTAKVKEFLGRGETVLDLIARTGITLYDIRNLSKSELGRRIDEGAVRRSQEPRPPRVIVVGN